MISVTEAKRILAKNLPGSQISECSIYSSYNKILAADAVSAIDVPSFDNSAMDGYAFLYEASIEELEVSGEVQAGFFPEESVGKGSAFRIFTGGCMPKGADTVIPQELVKVHSNDRISFDIRSISPAANVRKTGEQTQKGEIVVRKGHLLNPGSVGLLASVGINEVKIYQKPKVGIIVTGNELIEPGKDLKPGQIYNSNGPLLCAALKKYDIEPHLLLRAEDNRKLLDEKIALCLERCDLLLLTGGISVGDYDLVYDALASKGVRELFYKVKQRPGKPFFAGKKDEKIVFALPGNPASVASCFVQYIKPVIKHFLGYGNVWAPDALLPLETDIQKKRGLTFFLKCTNHKGKARITTGQQSFNLMPYGKAKALAELQEEVERVEAGTLVKIYYW